MMERANPTIILIGGPNGAGKSTVAPRLIADVFGFIEFVNADVIAAGLSGFHPDRQAFAAGRIMLRRLRDLAAARESFAFETTLASRSFSRWLHDLCHEGYIVQIVYVWLASAKLAISRVTRRVQAGGHAVPAETFRRRYTRSIRNFRLLYMPLADSWYVYNNSDTDTLDLVAYGGSRTETVIRCQNAWNQIQQVT